MSRKLKKHLNIFFLNDLGGGGTKTFTAHLVHSLKMIGVSSSIYKLGQKSFLTTKDFGYGCDYFNLSISDALNLCAVESCLITSVAKKHRDLCSELLNKGARTIIHDPLEITKGHYRTEDLNEPIVIRKNNLKLVSSAVFIPHPYVKVFVGDHIKKKNLAISLTRIARVKHTDWLLEANRKLSITRNILIRGAEDRIYSYYTLKKRFPEWIVGAHGYGHEWGAAQRLYASCKYSIDLTEIPNDGGGSQYSFLESMDVGTVPILHESWLRIPGEMKENFNCLKISNKEQLIAFLKNHEKIISNEEYRKMVENCKSTLEFHDPIKVANKFKRELKL